MTQPISPPLVTNYRPEFTPAYLSNGLIGMRVKKVPLSNGLTVVNGFAGLDQETRVESSVPAPEPLGGDIKIGDVWISSVADRINFEEQAYDFSCGELRTSFNITLDGVKLRAEVLTFCSRSLPSVVLQETRIQVDSDCDVILRAMVDPTGVPGEWLSRETSTPGVKEAAVDGSLLWGSVGDISSCGAAYVTETRGLNDAERSVAEHKDQGPLATDYKFRAKYGNRHVLRHYTAMISSTTHEQPDRHCVRVANLARKKGFDTLREENRSKWKDIWRGRVNLVGANRKWQAIADAAFFYLHSSVHPSSPASTSLFGLSRWHNYHYYRGQIMWDMEAFGLPPLILGAPEAARTALDYRFDRLAAARAHARIYGYRGLQFPWESSPRSGAEAAPGEGPAASFEHHVSLDVALAFAQYAHATGDRQFLDEQAWPVLSGVSEWIESRVAKTERGYEIREVLGVAEKKEPVNNNAFVNMAAVRTLQETISAAERLGRQFPPRWKEIADQLIIPLDPDTNVIKNHDDYLPDEEKGETPEAPAGFFPVGYQAEPAVEQATLAYYLKLAPKYVGAPMLSAVLGVYAARIGDREMSAELFERGYADFILEPFSMTDEYSPKVFPEMPRAGSFVANAGGFLTSCLFGLPGIRLGPGDPDSWCERPVVMPTSWEGIEVERIWVRGEEASLSAHHGDPRARISMPSGKPQLVVART